MTTLKLRNIGQVKNAEISFGDLTVFVGPQASGKSIALQWLKLLADTGQVQDQLRNYGLDWSGDLGAFLDLYFGEGMRSQWRTGKSQVDWNGKVVDVASKAARKAKGKAQSVFLIPAQRVLTLRDGWPRPFGDYAAGDPFAVRAFSESLRVLMERELAAGEDVFPHPRRLKNEYRQMLQDSIFATFDLRIDKLRSQKRLVLGGTRNSESLPYMVWSAGQREFVPLLLGLYWLMPSSSTSRRDDIKWVVIEEPEMGLHPRAITTVLMLITELLSRGYKVCLSTHSPQVLDAVWALQTLRQHESEPQALLKVFDAPDTQPLRGVAESALTKKTKVYYFERGSGCVHDITGLDPSSLQDGEATWGGLLEFSGRANEAVARAVSNDW